MLLYNFIHFFLSITLYFRFQVRSRNMFYGWSRRLFTSDWKSVKFANLTISSSATLSLRVGSSPCRCFSFRARLRTSLLPLLSFSSFTSSCRSATLQRKAYATFRVTAPFFVGSLGSRSIIGFPPREMPHFNEYYARTRYSARKTRKSSCSDRCSTWTARVVVVTVQIQVP